MPSSSIPASTACEPTTNSPALADTCAEIIQQQYPNFFRLYLNPFVVQTCMCLGRYVQTMRGETSSTDALPQSFLANSFDEALSGAIKLARYSGALEQRPSLGLVIDRGNRLGAFAFIAINEHERIDFVPNLRIVGDDKQLDAVLAGGERFGFIIVLGAPCGAEELLRTLMRQQSPLIVLGVSRSDLTAWQQAEPDLQRGVRPDVVVFDESFVNHAVPFAAFTARKSLYDLWNRMKQSAFHSTTYQPNTISSLHFMKCVRQADPQFCMSIAADLERIRRDPVYCASLLADLYRPFLARAIATLGFDARDVRAAGHYVVVDGQKVFDGVAGIACSVRGHNPPSYLAEVQSTRDEGDCCQRLTELLKERTGLSHLLPAVSGATAVETALRIALAVQFPKQWVLAFKGGFGGKTLLALTGTANASYKTHLSPLYENVTYIDPWAPTVIDDLETALRTYPVAVVQVELIQAVGGVRPLPTHVLRYLEEHKRRWGYLLFVDEVQTGMYRTGPLLRASQVGVTPDLVTMGKGVSDMMFPFALTLYSDEIHGRLEETQPELAPAIRRQYDHEAGYATVLNTLQRADEIGMVDRVNEAGALFAKLLKEGLALNKMVGAIRVYGLLIAIELDAERAPLRWLKKHIALPHLLGLLRHEAFPVLIGYCQYEPHVLKLTPPLSITPTEIRQTCMTIAAVLNRSPYRLLMSALVALAQSSLRHRWRRFKERR